MAIKDDIIMSLETKLREIEVKRKYNLIKKFIYCFRVKPID